MNKFLRSNFLLEIALYLLSFGLSYILAFYVRLEGHIPPETWAYINKTLLFVVLLRAATFTLFRVFHGQWRYCSILDVIAIVKAVTISSILLVGLFYFLFSFQHLPRTVFIIDWMIVTLMVCGIRFSRRLLKELLLNTSQNIKRVLIVGANDIGKNLINEMKSNWDSGYYPVALVDDDPKNLNQVFYGVKVVGTRMSIPHIASTQKLDEISS